MSKILIAYDPRDERHKEALVEHLGILQEEGLVEEWNELKVVGSDDEAFNHYASWAKLILFIVSDHFSQNSDCDYIRQLALDAKGDKKEEIIYIMVDPLIYDDENTLVLPDNNFPITNTKRWGSESKAWLYVAENLKSRLHRSKIEWARILTYIFYGVLALVCLLIFWVGFRWFTGQPGIEKIDYYISNQEGYNEANCPSAIELTASVKLKSRTKPINYLDVIVLEKGGKQPIQNMRMYENKKSSFFGTSKNQTFTYYIPIDTILQQATSSRVTNFDFVIEAGYDKYPDKKRYSDRKEFVLNCDNIIAPEYPQHDTLIHKIPRKIMYYNRANKFGKKYRGANDVVLLQWSPWVNSTDSFNYKLQIRSNCGISEIRTIPSTQNKEEYVFHCPEKREDLEWRVWTVDYTGEEGPMDGPKSRWNKVTYLLELPK